MKKARVYRWLEVTERRGNGVWVKVHGFKLNGCVRWFSLRQWQKWAANAETVDA
jgi:hypothetical protein